MKQMDMRYMSPSMPVNVTLQQDNSEQGTSLSRSTLSESKHIKNKQEATVVDNCSGEGGHELTHVPSFKALTKLFEPTPVSPRNTTLHS